ncbi:hypothetical protein RF11_05789 [Thelohanellus kitauei]|uniref:ISXO2-like transposase domain-containing protein n=1 Tax=Thelohanellus kitauei TaxID=669202 RepID=A0A0C2IW46_THEKT|nr:hypothetical protein RF11_05789 [Thelohanellus kitauei]
MYRSRRAICKLAPDKIVQLIFHWATQRSIKHSNLLQDVSKLIKFDWFNHCREVCRRRNFTFFKSPRLGNGNEHRINCQTPDIVIQIDGTLLKHTPEEIEERKDINENGQLGSSRNQGRRITGPWIFGFEQESFLRIIRGNVTRGSIIWSDMWPAYMQIGQDGDGLIHESVNHSKRFVIEHGVHAQNIERDG